MSELSSLDRLKIALATLDQQYNSTYKTPEAIYALIKTLQTFNITITDWNTLIEYINTVGNTMDALYAIIPEIVGAIQEQAGVDLISDQTAKGVKTFEDGIKVPAPTDNDNAVNKKYVDDANDALNSAKLDKTLETYKVYGTNANGVNIRYPIHPGVQDYAVPIRGINGELEVPETPENDTDASSKKYVDSILALVNNFLLNLSAETPIMIVDEDNNKTYAQQIVIRNGEAVMVLTEL